MSVDIHLTVILDTGSQRSHRQRVISARFQDGQSNSQCSAESFLTGCGEVRISTLVNEIELTYYNSQWEQRLVDASPSKPSVASYIVLSIHPSVVGSLIPSRVR